MPPPPAGPFEIPDAKGHSIGLSRATKPVAAETVAEPDVEVLDFQASGEGLLLAEVGEDEELVSATMEVAVPVSQDVLISMDAAAAKLGPAILETLDAQFKGKLSEVRQLDGRDLIF